MKILKAAARYVADTIRMMLGHTLCRWPCIACEDLGGCKYRPAPRLP